MLFSVATGSVEFEPVMWPVASCVRAASVVKFAASGLSRKPEASSSVRLYATPSKVVAVSLVPESKSMVIYNT